MRRSVQAVCLGVLLFLGQALYAGPLDDFAVNARGTSAQVGIAEAIQSVCPALVGTFGGVPGILAAPASQRRDITLRCNELVLTAVDLNDTTGAPPPARSLLIGQSDLLAALQQVTGEEISSQNTLAVRASNSQYANVAARLTSLRGAVSRGASGSVADSGTHPGNTTSFLGGGAASGDTPAQTGFFINGNVNSGERDQSDFEDGFDFDAVSLTAGFDHRFERGVLGVSLGFDQYEADFDTSTVVSGGDIDSDGYSISVFGLLDFGNMYLDAIATAGRMDVDMSRSLVYASGNPDPACDCPDQMRSFDSDTEADHMSLNVSLGWNVYSGAWAIQPSITVAHRQYDVDGFTEQDNSPLGGMALRFGDQHIESTRSIVGVRFDRIVNRDFGVLRPSFGIEWHHEFEDTAEQIYAKYAFEDTFARDNPTSAFSGAIRDCLSCFRIVGEEPDSDFAVVSLGLTFVLPRQRAFSINYEGLLGYEDLTSHAINLTYRLQF